MADRSINFRIKVIADAANARATASLEKLAHTWENTFGPKAKMQGPKNFVDEIQKAKSELGKLLSDPGGYKDLLAAQKKLADEQAKLNAQFAKPQGMKGLSQGLDNVLKKAVSLRGILAGSAVFGGAVYGVKRLFEEGQQQNNTRNRIRREFGSDADRILGIGDRVGLASGVQGDEAAKGLIPLAEQLQAIQAGSQFRGMRKPLSETEATALRQKNLTFGSDIFKRVQTLSPEIDPGELGRVLGDALSGPEGIRSMISTLGLSRRSRTLSTLNEKGEAFKALSPEERNRLGISKKGQYLEQGDLVNLLLQRSGITDAAATDERKKFSFQARSIQAQATDVLGDIGSQALDALNEKLGKGKTLAESLHDYLASDEGKKNIKDIADGVASFASSLVDVLKELPKIGSFLSDNKATILAIAAAYGGIKLGGAASGIVSAGKNLGGVSGGALGGLGQAAGVAGLLITVGSLGYAFGTLLDKTLGLSDGLSKWAFDLFGKSDKEINAESKTFVDSKTKIRNDNIALLEKSGLSHGLAVRYADHPEERLAAAANRQPHKGDATAALAHASGTSGKDVHLTTNVHLDGQVLAKVLSKHMAKDISRQTARGAAPISKE